MDSLIKIDTHNELISEATKAINNGYKFDELDGSFADGGAIIMRNDDNNKIALVCEDDTEAEGLYTDLYEFMQNLCGSVFKSYIRSLVYLD